MRTSTSATMWACAHRFWIVTFGLAAVSTIPFATRAQERLGGEFQVNTYTTSFQRRPSVAMDGAGSFVVVWDSELQEGVFGRGVFGRRFENGAPSGVDFQVNAYIPGAQENPAVAIDAGGDFVVVWESYAQDGSSDGVFAQRFLPSASKTGPEIPVNTYTTFSQLFPSVAMDPDGNFVVLWQSSFQDGSGEGVFGQRFTNGGTPSGAEFQANDYTSSDQSHPSVGMDADGDFVVVWDSDGPDGSYTGIFGQRFTSAGAPVGDRFHVNTYTTSSQSFPAVAMDADGDFVVTWLSLGQDGDSWGVFGRRYASGGSAIGGEFQVNTYTTFGQVHQAVSMDADGNFVVVWTSQGDGDSAGIFGQRFTSSGARLGAQFQVNTYTTAYQSNPSVALNGAGHFVVVWQSPGQDGGDDGIFGQRFRFGELDFFIGDDEDATTSTRPIEATGKRR